MHRGHRLIRFQIHIIKPCIQIAVNFVHFIQRFFDSSLISIAVACFYFIFLNIVILDRSHIGHRITNTECRHEQTGAAADTDQHHKQPLLVKQHIARRDLAQKGESVPNRLDIFKDHSLTNLARPGTDERCRNADELLVT